MMKANLHWIILSGILIAVYSAAFHLSTGDFQPIKDSSDTYILASNFALLRPVQMNRNKLIIRAHLVAHSISIFGILITSAY